METIFLRASKIGADREIQDYKEPIEQQKIKLADGVYLCDPLLGVMGGVEAKEIEKGVYQSTRLNNHFMYEKTALEVEEG